MKTYDIIVIGGGPAGLVTAMTAKEQHPDKTVLLITEFSKNLVPCGIPYIFHKLGDIEKNLMGHKPLVGMGGEILIQRVEHVDAEKRTISTASGETLGFDKLVFATGSRPIVPTFLPGHDLQKVVYVPKTYDGISAIHQNVQSVKKIVILGSGFTAVELAEQIAQEPGKEVHLVYRATHCLRRSFSESMAVQVDKSLEKAGVILHPSSLVKKIVGKNSVATNVQIKNGEKLPADLVIIAMGYQANSELAIEAGLTVNEHRAIVVDNYLRTSNEGIFAVGDCAQTLNFLTGGVAKILLASTGAAEARILGHNLYSMRIKRNFPGTLSVFSTELCGQTFASAGVTTDEAEAAGISFLTGEFQDVDRHPGSLSDVSPVGAKIIISPDDGQILGGELFGSKSVGEMINTLALAIQKNVTVYELTSFQLGTHPLLTTAPTKPILIKAAEKAIQKRRAS